MKQRIRVTAICRREGTILLLKRSGGRAEVAPGYELPTGKIYFGEQPEEAMTRTVYDFLGIHAESVRLADAVTFTNLQHASELSNLFIVYEVEIGDSEIKIATERYSAYKWVKCEETDNLALGEESLMVLRILSSRSGTRSGREVFASETSERATANAATIYVDGGSRGNPGPSGLGYYILAPDGVVLKRGGEFLGFSTSRLAEYYALKEGIEQAIELGLKRVRFVSDSLMLVNQMNGVYKVKNQDLMQVHADVLKLLERLESYSFVHVPREKNREADHEVNKVIDANIKGSVLA